MTERRLISISEGVYSVSEVCHILAEGMTARRVHYWLRTGLVSGEPVARGRRGIPTLLTFRQLLEIRTVQQLRDELRVPLPKVREAYAWILQNLFEDEQSVEFSRGQGGAIIAETGDGESIVIPYGQGVFPNLTALTDDALSSRRAWADGRLTLRDHLVTDTRILAGAPTVSGTRIETAILAAFAEEGSYDDEVIRTVSKTYPHLGRDAVVDAFEFEGIPRAA